MTAVAFLSGCGMLSDRGDAAAPEIAVGSDATQLVERDTEAPEIFRTEDSALWDGRPSLGGIWVAAPGVTEPERVIMRAANGKSVVGALFKRERANPGPALQLSSEAAAALGILAGAPTVIEVVALRREEVPNRSPDPGAGAAFFPAAHGVVPVSHNGAPGASGPSQMPGDRL